MTPWTLLKEGQYMKIMTYCALLAAVFVTNGAPSVELAEPSELDVLKSKYEKAQASIDAIYAEQKSEAMSAYERLLDAYKTRLKQEGQLQAYLEIEKEADRLKDEQKIPSGSLHPYVSKMIAAHDTFLADAEAAHQKQMALLASQYDARLTTLIRTLMQADRIEEAKLAQLEKNRAGFELAVIEDKNATLPTPQALPQPTPPKRPAIPNGAIRYGGHHYGIIEKLQTWQEAKKTCENMGGHLVVITSAQELNAVVPLASKAIARYRVKTCWIGHRLDVKQWVGVTGEELSFFNWRPGEPSNRAGHENVAVLREDGLWADTSSSDITRPSICEWEY